MLKISTHQRCNALMLTQQDLSKILTSSLFFSVSKSFTNLLDEKSLECTVSPSDIEDCPRSPRKRNIIYWNHERHATNLNPKKFIYSKGFYDFMNHLHEDAKHSPECSCKYSIPEIKKLKNITENHGQIEKISLTRSNSGYKCLQLCLIMKTQLNKYFRLLLIHNYNVSTKKNFHIQCCIFPHSPEALYKKITENNKKELAICKDITILVLSFVPFEEIPLDSLDDDRYTSCSNNEKKVEHLIPLYHYYGSPLASMKILGNSSFLKNKLERFEDSKDSLKKVIRSMLLYTCSDQIDQIDQN